MKPMPPGSAAVKELLLEVIEKMEIIPKTLPGRFRVEIVFGNWTKIISKKKAGEQG